MNQDSHAVYPGIYGLKKIFKQESYRLVMKEKGNADLNYPEIKSEFEPLLVGLLEEIFNPEIPFVQTSVEEHCQYCPYTSICGKQSAQS
jgi:hypothetical protein